MYDKLEVDVLVMGGGLAGLNAAIAALERGARVAVMEKAKIERSGDIAGGVDHFMAYLETGEEWDTREAYLNYVESEARGAVDIRIHERVFCDELFDAIQRMARIGNPLTYKGTTSYYRTASFGQPGPYWINFEGKYLKPKLAREVRRLGGIVLDRTMATKFFVRDNRIQGVTGVNVRNGQFVFVSAKAVIAASGNTNRLFETPTSMPFNTWLCPYNTGDAQTLAFEAGATMANMEYLRMTIVPKGFSAPGLNAFTGIGACFINSLGERYMERYHPLKDKAPRNEIVFAALTEIKEGRGPLFVDCRHLPEEKITHLKTTLGYDKETLPDYFHQKSIDLSVEPLEIMVSEAMQTGPLEVVGSGIKIDINCMSTVQGLFAAGDCADQMKCVHMAVAGGYAAGKCAQRYAATSTNAGDVAESTISAEKKRVFAPLGRNGGADYREIEDVLRKITAENVGPDRTETSLRTAQRKIAELRKHLGEIRAKDHHELMRALETASLMQVASLMTDAALSRKESRFIPYHHRLDYPNTDNENWCGQMLIVRDGEGTRTTFSSLQREGR
ncbi:MAG: FAD-binding protein [Dehalococcoidales bacterium]|nr:FAD-binding protein [Dehalococcoidales bacterium]